MPTSPKAPTALPEGREPRARALRRGLDWMRRFVCAPVPHRRRSRRPWTSACAFRDPARRGNRLRRTPRFTPLSKPCRCPSSRRRRDLRGKRLRCGKWCRTRVARAQRAFGTRAPRPTRTARWCAIVIPRDRNVRPCQGWVAGSNPVVRSKKAVGLAPLRRGLSRMPGVVTTPDPRPRHGDTRAERLIGSRERRDTELLELFVGCEGNARRRECEQARVG